MIARPNWHYDRYGDKGICGACSPVLSDYQYRRKLSGKRNADSALSPDRLREHSLWRRLHRIFRLRAYQLCHDRQLPDREYHYPPDAVAWCGNSYYKPGVGTYWSYFQAAASHFGCGSVTDQQCQYGTSGTLRRLSGHLLSQRAGLFTSGGHFIVLRGVTANGKVLVNDPNDSDAKNYINREFDMMSEIHATANAYWIFDKNKGAIMNRTKVILSIF